MTPVDSQSVTNIFVTCYAVVLLVQWYWL